MSSPVPPTQGSNAMRPAQGLPTPTARRGGAFEAAMAAQAPSVRLQTFPSSPPREVLDEMASAARVHDALRAQGRELHFAHDAQSGRMTVQVRDSGGHVLRTISPSEALKVAAGKPLE